MADRLLYGQHDPSEVERLFRKAVLNSPADGRLFLSYGSYLTGRRCCPEQAALLLEEAIRRNPRSLNYYHIAIEAFLQQGDQAKALQYFQEAARLGPQISSELLTLMVRYEANPKFTDMVPRNPENMQLLLRILATRSFYKSDWIRILREAQIEDPKESLSLAKQALELREYDIAREYALRALNHPETEPRAKRILSLVEKLKS